MNIERRIGRHRIGSWEFLPESGELRRRSDVRRLEPRAAKVLEMLCDAEGGVVSHDQLIRGVWEGRSLSENSVAVVIGQLRKALEDDGREPRLIETIPKRGYRLVRAVAPSSADVFNSASRDRRPWLLALLGLAVLLVAIAIWPRSNPTSAGRVVVVSDVVNETGNGSYAPHVRATSELIVNQLGRRGFAVRRTPGGSGLRLASKLVMWNGAPYLGMTATDDQGAVRWSAMIKGGPAEVPGGVANEFDGFARKFPPN